jgi:hypothetical protein
MEHKFVDKLFTIAGESIGEYHQARLLYENSEKEANEAMNIAKKKKQKSEELLLNLIKKEEEKNEAIKKAVGLYNDMETINPPDNIIKNIEDKSLNDIPIPPTTDNYWNPNMHD